MKFPLFSKSEKSTAAARVRQERFEKAISDSLRMLGQVCTKLADAVEAQRLSRAGYTEQEKFLERTDRKKE
ncbi:MAG: hypothetical protein ACYC8T_05440 [Myxococcaceae bacterium]